MLGADLRMWVVNIYFLLGLLVVLAVLAVVTIVVIAVIRARIWRAGVKRAERQDWQRKHRPDGQPYPPSGRGICDSCQKQSEKVYFLESNSRLCPECYEKMHHERE